VVLAGSTLAVMFGTLMYLQMSATKRMEQEIELEVAERVPHRCRQAQTVLLHARPRTGLEPAGAYGPVHDGRGKI